MSEPQKPLPGWAPCSRRKCQVLQTGVFTLLAWDDGVWAIRVGDHGGYGGYGLRACAPGGELPTIDDAKLACEGAFRNLLAESAGIFPEGL